MPDDPPTSPEVVQMLEGIQRLQAMFSVVRDSALGYRHQLMTQGVGEDAADKMTVDYHAAVTRLVLEGALRAASTSS